MSRESYEAVPYPTAPHVESHPSTMQAIATAFGLNPPAITNARVLELGCATGGNIIPMACALPNAKFVGIDYSPGQIEATKTFATAVNANNLTLEAISILDITPEFGQFDYIIAHGIFSWVPENVRDRVLTICRENLSERGVAYISFNCYPGWHLMDWLRELALTVAPANPSQSPEARLKSVRDTIEVVLDSQKLKDAPIGAALRQLATEYKSAGNVQWLHDLMEEDNHPIYFKDFVARAQSRGLQYLADRQSGGSFVEERIPQTKTLLDSVGEDWIKREQILDFLRNNTFRRALLVKSECKITRANISDRFQDFFVTTVLKPKSTGAALSDSTVVEFHEPAGAGMSTDAPLSKMSLAMLGSAFPRAICLRELLDQAAASLQMSREAFNSARSRTLEEFVIAWVSGIVQAGVTPPPIALSPGDRPEIWKLARYQASIGQLELTNLRHEVVKVDPNDHAMIEILQLLDGTRKREEIIETLAARTSQPIESIRASAWKTIETILHGAVRHGLLVR